MKQDISTPLNPHCSPQPSRRRSGPLGCLLAAVLCVGSAQAQTAYPEKPITLVVGFAPGTAPDILARQIAEPLGKALNTSVIVDNKSGAGGQIAATAVARSAPDGYQLLLGEMGAIAIAPAAFKTVTYNGLTDFVPISEVARSEFVWIVPVKRNYKSMADFVDRAKKSGGKTFVATFGAGSPGHFGAEVFSQREAFAIEPVHYRQVGDGLTALANGDVEGAMVSVAFAAAQLKGGKLAALAQTGDARSKLIADVPTVVEAGYPSMKLASWFALLAPAGTPAAVVNRVSKAIVEVTKDAAMAQKLADVGFIVVGSSPAEMAKLLSDDVAKWKRAVEQSGFKGTGQ